jgi:hypothetical protein
VTSAHQAREARRLAELALEHAGWPWSRLSYWIDLLLELEARGR